MKNFVPLRMLRAFFAAAFFIALFPAAHLASAADVVLIDSGVARCVISAAPETMAPDITLPRTAANDVTEAEQSRRRLRESVRDLSRCLGKMSRATVAITTNAPAAANDGTIEILVGEPAAKIFGPPKKTSKYRQAWRIAVTPQRVGLIGASDESASYAVYELLDRLGCRWFMPGEIGEVIPGHRTVSFAPFDDSGVPGTISRQVWYADEAYKRRNRLGGFHLAAGHALEIANYVPKEALAAHPDWNAELNGKRSVNGRFCWASSELAAAVADGINKHLDQHHSRSVSISPDDGINFCECAKCKALDAGDFDPTLNTTSISDRFIHFANQIATRVAAKHPDVLLGFLAYAQYTRPPRREKLHPNLVPLIAPITYCRAHAMTDPKCPSRAQIRPIIEGWGKASPTVAYYNYMFHLAEVSVPYPMMRQMSDELPVLYANNVVLWNPETMPNYDSVLPGMVLTLRKAWNPSAPSAEILSDFFSNFYGPASAPIRRYWEIFDDAWTQTPSHTGCGFGYAKTFPPAVLRAAREAMNAALAEANSALIYRRVKIQDDALRQFELFMKLREDLCAGRLARLEHDSLQWRGTQLELSERYAENFAFSKTGWSQFTIAGGYFRSFFDAAYQDGARIARDFTVISPAVREWRHHVDREKRGDAQGFGDAAFDDKSWKTTDACVETWGDLGLENYYGAVWYRQSVKLAAVPAGKKVWLWISSTDGSARVFVNGKPISFTNKKGETKTEASDFCQPFSFDVTDAIKPNAANQITIVGTRTFLNELGTGGLLGPVLLYREK